MDNDMLEEKLSSYFDGNDATVIHRHIKRRGTVLYDVRDAMLDIGVILEEDLENGIYVTRVTGGRRKAFGPIIAATPNNGGVDVAGIVVRNREKPTIKAMSSFEGALDGNPSKPLRRHIRLRLFFLLMIVVAFVVTISHLYLLPHIVIPAQAATLRYNEAVEEFNAIVPRYNNSAKDVSVENLRGFVQEAQELSVQETNYASICKSVVNGNNAMIIDRDTATVKLMAEELEKEIAVLEAINNPSEEWVESKLKGIDGISQVKSVTPNNDPNHMLGKEGGYSSCTYFTTDLLGENIVEGSNPVQKGVDGGGAVEVYPTLEDAQARCEYLSEFDGTILYSGSYALVGTMVIRTSCLLDDNAQYALTSNIVDSMTRM